jgi:hypothetical protein
MLAQSKLFKKPMLLVGLKVKGRSFGQLPHRQVAQR